MPHTFDFMSHIFFLNLSSGHVVDIKALKENVVSGKIKGVAVDVFPEEPLSNNHEFVSELKGLPNVMLTPHIGGSTLEAQESIGSRYLVGDAITAADVYWSTMSMCVLPAPPEIMPLTRQNQGMLKFFAANGQIPAVADALTERIETHQRYILSTYCETPAVLGGDLL